MGLENEIKDASWNLNGCVLKFGLKMHPQIWIRDVSQDLDWRCVSKFG